jgi:hypothetical protein
MIIPLFVRIKKAHFFGPGVDSFFTLNIQPDVRLPHGGNILGGILMLRLILFAGAGCTVNGKGGILAAGSKPWLLWIKLYN